MHWICPLYKLSTCWAQQVERIWTPCWEVLSGVESCWVKFETGQTFRWTLLGISFVSRSFMRGSTQSSGFAQQRSTCWAHARAVCSVSKNCHGSFKSFPCSLQCPRSWALSRGSGRVFSGFGIWPKYGAGIGKTMDILTGSGIRLFPGKRDSPQFGHGMRDLCLRVCRECWKSSRATPVLAAPKRINQASAKWCLLSNQRPYGVSG